MKCIFPAKWGTIGILEEGHYTLVLKSTLESKFYNFNTYMMENS